MNDPRPCPVCNQLWGASCRELPSFGRDASHFQCDVCGTFAISGTAFATKFSPDHSSLTEIQRAHLSHILCTTTSETEPSTIDTTWLTDVFANSTLPDPAMRAARALRYIGDEVTKTGSPIPKLDIKFGATIGAPNYKSVARLIQELSERSLVSIGSSYALHGYTFHLDVDLTLSGWEAYREDKISYVSGEYGFIAMQFNDPTLDPFVEEVIKPTVKAGTGYDLVHMRDVGRAGVIDNIMRTQIKQAEFVIADLTHDNSGAYWEAGYAEGLGKPVVYICEQEKFEERKTHFDTNHCTTVMWSKSEDSNFEEELVSTLRRSLNKPPLT